MSPSVDKQADIIVAFNTTSKYMDATFKIDNIYFDNNGKSKGGKDQELIQSSTTPDPRHHMGK